MVKVATSRLAKVLAAGALSAGLLTAVPTASHAAVDGMYWNWSNWSNWWEAHAEISIYNPSICRQSVARLGDDRRFGEPSRRYSLAQVNGFNFTHEAFQRGC
ncbi:hypothetical protein [Sinomonas sp. ASV322]|uniref:hypothetical protein n=1 Tax=Sinomonas sp. ASV322 TaxID=3041920 RepID=UPI0027DBFF20|nr:hypothetical protein [Sinomonas sp. ASV322]MDQ4501623.1 hypothetical protein [Sinomonas sp. ASV322]